MSLIVVHDSGGRKQSVATLQLQVLKQPHPHITGWTWATGRVIWPNGVSIKGLLYLLILLVTYMILGPLAPWALRGRTSRPSPRADLEDEKDDRKLLEMPLELGVVSYLWRIASGLVNL